MDVQTKFGLFIDKDVSRTIRAYKGTAVALIRRRREDEIG